jgi:phage tail-like protein
MVTLLGPSGMPMGAWLFIKTYPVRWSTSDLDAQKEEVTIDTIELAYTRMQILRV